MVKIPDVIKQAARDLRNNQTEPEKKLWDEIRYDKLWIKFLRQRPIYVYTEDSGLDRFVIVDFVSLKDKIIIEVDGSIHDTLEVAQLDQYKEKLLQRLGYVIVRIRNEDIIDDIYQVLDRLKYFIKSKHN